jgi:hypothetical protein
MVISDGKTKVAQYCQWDGYPTGQGQDILKFFRNNDLLKFKSALDKCVFISDDDVKEKLLEFGVSDGWMNMEQAKKFKAKYPQLSRDMGAEVLAHIYNAETVSVVLTDNTNFAGDSLFCEWAYVLDLDANKLEVYKGFNQTPLSENDRFYSLQESIKKREEPYYPVKLIATYDLSSIPTDEDFEQLEKEAYAEDEDE